MNNYQHIPVMLEEVIENLNIKKDGKYIDGTLGGASYTKKITELAKEGIVMSIDLDPLAIDNFSKQKTDRNIVVNDNFSNLKNIVLENFDDNVKFDGIVADLGLSSAQLDDESRGFSFLNSQSLDMSFGPKIDKDTYYIVNNYKESELERLIKEYGEEPWAKIIARNICTSRKKSRINSSSDLAEIIKSSIPKRFWTGKINPATKTFQAFRMETNDEIKNLENFLDSAISLLNVGGRLVIVSFHSLEDRVVKLLFKNKYRENKDAFKIVTKKPIKPSEKEVLNNNRSRSAKLRVLEKIK
ncbi:MAG: 16S rRNA (cytosine(1402)-N(4))-methyltransferase RsmH [Patescibacteria group bacterium]